MQTYSEDLPRWQIYTLTTYLFSLSVCVEKAVCVCGIYGVYCLSRSSSVGLCCPSKAYQITSTMHVFNQEFPFMLDEWCAKVIKVTIRRDIECIQIPSYTKYRGLSAQRPTGFLTPTPHYRKLMIFTHSSHFDCTPYIHKEPLSTWQVY